MMLAESGFWYVFDIMAVIFGGATVLAVVVAYLIAMCQDGCSAQVMVLADSPMYEHWRPTCDRNRCHLGMHRATVWQSEVKLANVHWKHRSKAVVSIDVGKYRSPDNQSRREVSDGS